MVVILSLACAAGGTGCGSCRGAGQAAGTGEQPADVGNPKALDREGFSLEYPGNWEIDESDPEHDPDRTFSIDSPGDCMAMFFVEDSPIDSGIMVEEQVRGLERAMTGIERTPVHQWGSFAGEGARLSGRIRDLDATVLVFSHSWAGGTFTVVEQCYLEDMEMVKPGYELIERTFVLEE